MRPISSVLGWQSNAKREISRSLFVESRAFCATEELAQKRKPDTLTRNVRVWHILKHHFLEEATPCQNNLRTCATFTLPRGPLIEVQYIHGFVGRKTCWKLEWKQMLHFKQFNYHESSVKFQTRSLFEFLLRTTIPVAFSCVGAAIACRLFNAAHSGQIRTDHPWPGTIIQRSHPWASGESISHGSLQCYCKRRCPIQIHTVPHVHSLCVSIKDLVFQRCTHCLSSLRLQFLPTLNFAILYLTFSRSGVGTKMPSGRSCHVGSGRCAGSLIYSNIIQH